VVLFALRLHKPDDSGVAAQFRQVQQALEAGAAPAAKSFAVVRGLVFREDLDKAYGSARRITARIGNEVEVELLTVAEDADILEILAELDVAGINAMTSAPMPGIGAGGVVAASAPAASSGGGLAAWFGGGSGGSGTANKPKPGFGSSCASDKGFKRCSVGD
jgi:hypothetical protein